MIKKIVFFIILEYFLFLYAPLSSHIRRILIERFAQDLQLLL